METKFVADLKGEGSLVPRFSFAFQTWVFRQCHRWHLVVLIQSGVFRSVSLFLFLFECAHTVPGSLV